MEGGGDNNQAEAIGLWLWVVGEVMTHLNPYEPTPTSQVSAATRSLQFPSARRVQPAIQNQYIKERQKN